MTWLLGCAVLGVFLSGCGCFDEQGNMYACSCERRCQGATTTWRTTIGCTTTSSAAVSAATRNCVSSCTPEASCTSCTCSAGSSCTIEKQCR